MKSWHLIALLLGVLVLGGCENKGASEKPMEPAAAPRQTTAQAPGGAALAETTTQELQNFEGTKAPVGEQLYRAQYLEAKTPATLRLGSRQTVKVTLKNAGTSTWPQKSFLRLAYHWHGLDGAISDRDSLRTNLPKDMGPGETVVVDANLGTPAAPGQYILSWDMVYEGHAWFSLKGAPTLKQKVTVTK